MDQRQLRHSTPAKDLNTVCEYYKMYGDEQPAMYSMFRLRLFMDLGSTQDAPTVLSRVSEGMPADFETRGSSVHVTNKFWYVSMDWDRYYTHRGSFKMGSAILGPLCLVTVRLRIRLID